MRTTSQPELPRTTAYERSKNFAKKIFRETSFAERFTPDLRETAKNFPAQEISRAMQ